MAFECMSTHTMVQDFPQKKHQVHCLISRDVEDRQDRIELTWSSRGHGEADLREEGQACKPFVHQMAREMYPIERYQFGHHVRHPHQESPTSIDEINNIIEYTIHTLT
ncbi:hypothetical protein EYC84_009174 [Monilinia fructicola]|uniref:Uncharacterized protein n=1 Tax=Monilinia fructicola TaxID=38448 RepID=A0A5M9JE54_MONFR|nr:hypothetical protein EYC84_009174 [Monilinia fructicola]